MKNKNKLNFGQKALKCFLEAHELSANWTLIFFHTIGTIATHTVAAWDDNSIGFSFA